ncbi:MAG: hypothetical protein HC848_08440 [Limnobacter sp.]|nr:hypothetical protein [Limnobacter sp.]
MRKLKLVLILSVTSMLSSCDLSQIPGMDKRLSFDDSKAIGAACRHSGRALEDCFVLNPTAHQAGVFQGWRDMNDYMMANNLQVVAPRVEQSSFSPGGPQGGFAPSVRADSPGAAGQQHDAAGAAPPVGAERPRWDPSQLGRTSAAPEPSAEPALRPVSLVLVLRHNLQTYILTNPVHLYPCQKLCRLRLSLLLPVLRALGNAVLSAKTPLNAA